MISYKKTTVRENRISV